MLTTYFKDFSNQKKRVTRVLLHSHFLESKIIIL